VNATLWIAAAFALAVSPAWTQETRATSSPVDRAQALRGCFGTYDAAPRGKDHRVDCARLADELADLRANTYNWLIHARPTDWDDLKLFLPQAREKGIRVWVTLVPPSEQPPNNKLFAEPFRLDFERWAAEIAKLSLTEPNLVAWSLDDFAHNLRFFTPEKLRAIVGEARRINPALAFVPCCYFPEIKPRFFAAYRECLDGILFPYRHESARINLTDADLVAAEVDGIRAQVGASVPVIVDVYATAHSTLGGTTPEYVRRVMADAHQSADGVLVYCHQNPVAQAEKYWLIKEMFHRWTKSKPADAAIASMLEPPSLYRDLLAIFPEDRQGFGKDADKNADGPELLADHQPMTYGFVLSAEALHYRFDHNTESGRRVRKAARWLVDNCDLDGDGKPGWGLPQAWRAWGHEPNPHHQPYTITTAIVLNGLLDAVDIRDLWSATERDEALALCVQVAMRWCREMWSEGYGGGYFWYSPSKLDDIFGVNAPAMFLGSLARLLHDHGDRLAGTDRQLAQQRCDALAKAIVNTVQLHDGQPFWFYAPLPNKLNHERFEDAMHHVYTLWGIEGYRDAGGKVALSWTRAQALQSLDHFWKDGGVTENDQDLPNHKPPGAKPARLCGAGMLLLGYARWGNIRRAAQTLEWIHHQCGPWPQLRHSPTANPDTVYLRDCAHVLVGLAYLNYPPPVSHQEP
jgi:hypothetical protein